MIRPEKKRKKEDETESKLDRLKQKFKLYKENNFWLTAAGFLLAPILLTYLLYGVFTFSHSIVIFGLKIIAFVFLLAAIGFTFFIVPLLMVWGIFNTFKSMVENGFNEGIALAIPLSTVIFGISLGGLLQAGNFSLLWMMLSGAVGIPLIVMLVWIPLQRTLQVRKYRHSEQHLIEP